MPKRIKPETVLMLVEFGNFANGLVLGALLMHKIGIVFMLVLVTILSSLSAVLTGDVLRDVKNSIRPGEYGGIHPGCGICAPHVHERNSNFTDGTISYL